MTCSRFEDEGLARLEEGLGLDDHFRTCPDCVTARRAYEQIQADLRSLGSDQAPAEGWEAEVWKRIHDHGRGGRLRRAWWLAVPLAAALVAAVFFLPRQPLDREPRLTAQIEHDPHEVRRGDGAQPGDRLTLSATLPPARYAQVRIYQNERRLICETSVETDARRPVVVRTTCVLDSAGRYQVLALSADQPLPPSLGSPDQDGGAALAIGALVKVGPDVHVR